MRDLSIIIPARNEVFLQKTIENILENIEADTEIIAICDGYWPDPPVLDHPRVTVVHHTESIGQRAATNEGVRISQARLIAKCDAHCAFGKGFDRIILEDCQYDWTMIPQQFKLHAFDWKCKGCGNRTYQGVKPTVCKNCEATDFEMVYVWEPKDPPTIGWKFDNTLHFKYWHNYKKRPECQGDLVETMSCIGAFFLMHRKRFKRLGGMDEGHGSWGQYGTELACKTWLSGGKMIVSKKTWYAHMFRTGNFKGAFGGGSSFPYHISGDAQERAREYSRDLWFNNKWKYQKYPLKWLIDRFSPVPSWEGFQWKLDV